jgi:fumarate reductase subunit D
MARSHKPIVWSLFAGGGTFTAFVTPVMIFVTGLAVPLGLLSPEILAYDRMLSLVQNPAGKGLVFLAVFLPLWHAAHRLRITAHDLGIRSDATVSIVCYGAAMLGTVVAGVSLFGI